MSKAVEKLIDDIVKTEGGYVYHLDDKGGATCWGITQAVARSNGYMGDMRYYPLEAARAVYKKRYIEDPNFDKVEKLSERVFEEICDTGVNMGTATAGKFLQRALNALNHKNMDYKELVVDGVVGSGTLRALGTYLNKRESQEGEEVLLRVMNGLQVVRYVEITERDAKQKSFFFGWVRNRVVI